MKSASAPASARRTGPRTSGRPPKTSQEAIVAAAIALLEREPASELSLNGIAKELGITAMSLYNYFANRDELMQAVTRQLLAGLSLPVDVSAPWQQQITHWAEAVRAHFRRHPYLIHLLVWEGHTSVAWMRHTTFVTDALERAGLRGDALIQASLWVSHVIMSTIHVELLALEQSSALGEADLAAVEEPLRGKLRQMGRFAARKSYYDDTFRYTLGRLLEGLALQINRLYLP